MNWYTIQAVDILMIKIIGSSIPLYFDQLLGAVLLLKVVYPDQLLGAVQFTHDISLQYSFSMSSFLFFSAFFSLSHTFLSFSVLSLSFFLSFFAFFSIYLSSFLFFSHSLLTFTIFNCVVAEIITFLSQSN